MIARAFTFLPLLPLASSVSWEHHLVILLPLVWLVLVTLSDRQWPVPQTAVFALSLLCLLAIPHLPFGPPYGTDFARAAHTGSPLLILGANRLLVGTVLLFLTAPRLLSRQSSAAAPVEFRWPWSRAMGAGAPQSTWSSSELDRPA